MMASMILKYLKKFSEDYIGKKVKKAVITVPAHFNNSQREATKEAAINAGLEVIRIINEPTAAAIAYGYENESNEERKVLVFDLGGGTFDVSILKIKKYEFTVLSSCGDDHLGGEDFTKEFTDYLMKLFKQEYPQFEKIDFYNKEKEKEYKVFTRLKEEAEKAKKVLSNNKSTNIDLDGLYKKDFAVEIKRGEFEELCSHLWNKCIDYIKKALIDANLKKEDLDEVILIGGSSRIPKVQEIVENFIRGKDEKDNKKDNKKDNNKNSELKPKISKAINADEAVAMGAAIVACIENDNNKSKGVNLTINDITSKSIGIGTDEGKMEIIIPKGTILPVREKPLLLGKTFVPKTDFAKGVSVKIFESDNNIVSVDNLLKKFALTDLPIDVKEKVIIKILMYLDHNGIIKVDAKINDNLMKEVSGIKPSFSFK
jgi:molecular chaperone DnaK (HSP70)